MTDPDPATGAAGSPAFDAWWPHVGPWVGDDVDPIDIAHEAFCAGWEQAREAERQRWVRGIVRKSGIPKRADTHAECFVPLDLLDGDTGSNPQPQHTNPQP